MGVPFFFMLSGSILSYSYLGQLRFGAREGGLEARFLSCLFLCTCYRSDRLADSRQMTAGFTMLY